jgi:hypothetical protein
MNVAWAAITREQLERLYWTQQLTDEEIGLAYGVSTSTVKSKRRRFGIAGRTRNLAVPPLGDAGRSLRTRGPWER